MTYAAALFGRETVERWVGYLRRVLEGMVADETRRVDRLEIPVETWLAGATRHTVTVPAEPAVVRVVIDPEMVLPDVDRRNQAWRAP